MTVHSTSITRIITCQGTIQLITALSVLFYRQQEQPTVGRIEQNYLVIYDLFAPSDQIAGFIELIEKMARSLCPWTRVVYLTPDTLKALEQQMKTTSPKKLFGQVHSLIGTETADEIYLCRNWQFGNQLLMNAYQSAVKICYGDSIGLYFSENSALIKTSAPERPAPKKQTVWQRLWSKAALFQQQLRIQLQLRTVLSSLAFDVGYFMLPEILGETPPMPIVTIEPFHLFKVFQQLTHFVSRDKLNQFQTETTGAAIAVLLTSNLSEAGRLSQAQEIEAYRAFLLSENIQPDSILVIKPHPRDQADKLELLKKVCSDIVTKVVVLDDVELFFLPFEIFFLAAFRQGSRLSHPEIKLFAVSSACLSLKLLFDVPAFIGFGDTLTAQLFNPSHAASRREHEAILREALQRISASPLIPL